MAPLLRAVTTLTDGSTPAGVSEAAHRAGWVEGRSCRFCSRIRCGPHVFDSSNGQRVGTIDQEIPQNLASILMIEHQPVVAIAFVTAFLKARLELLELLKIGVPHHGGFGNETERTPNGNRMGRSVESQFLGIHDVKEANIMLLESQVLKTRPTDPVR